MAGYAPECLAKQSIRKKSHKPSYLQKVIAFEMAGHAPESDLFRGRIQPLAGYAPEKQANSAFSYQCGRVSAGMAGLGSPIIGMLQTRERLATGRA